MAGRIPAGLSRAEGRKFGLSVGAVFLVLAAVVGWRDHLAVARVLAGLGGALVLGGIFLPGAMGPVHRGWMGLALAISRVTTPIFMAIVYYLVLTPTGVLRRTLGRDPVLRTDDAPSFWTAREAGRRRSRLERQF